MNSIPETELVGRAQAGSADAFEQLVVHYQPRLTRYLCLRGLPRHDADDAVQRALIAAWQNLDSYRDKWRFSTWLYTITHRSIERLREQPDSPAIEAQAGDHDVFQRQLCDNVWAAARQHLEPEAFTAMWLHYGEGFSGAETARIMKRSQVWVRVGLHRSRQTLKRLLHCGEPA
ncbi:MAG: sigma-70 family RNA polymerase sigma factor [Wenzhouxiangellaceae bacterium]